MTDFALFVTNFVGLFMESAPWLLLGLLIAGIMHELVPVTLLQKHMGEQSVSAVVKAALIGAPLPLCSCGVIPAALGLRRSGASKPTTISFLVSTPETGVDSVSVSYALLGPLFAIVRPIAAIFSAIYAGLMIKAFAEPDEEGSKSPQQIESSCCSSKTPSNGSSCCSRTTQQETATTSCCSSKPQEYDDQPLKVVSALKYASGQLLQDLSVWLLIGLLLAAVIQTWVPTSFLTQWGDGFLAMLAMALIGVPMYICATASTPLAVGFLSAGLSPGAILVFLLAGPATNIATMGMIGRELGKRSLMLYIFSILTASIGLGYLLNYAVAVFNLTSFIPSATTGQQHIDQSSLISALSAVLLATLMVRNSWKQLSSRFSRTPAKSSCCH